MLRRASSKAPFLKSPHPKPRPKIYVKTNGNISTNKNNNPLKIIFNYFKPKFGSTIASIMDRQAGSPEDLRLKVEMEANNQRRINAAAGTPIFKGFNPEKDSEDRIGKLLPNYENPILFLTVKTAVTSAFEIGTFLAFLEAAKTGDFPGNRKTELPLWPQDQMQYFIQKYVDWAPKPYSELPQPGGPFGNIPGMFFFSRIIRFLKISYCIKGKTETN